MYKTRLVRCVQVPRYCRRMFTKEVVAADVSTISASVDELSLEESSSKSPEEFEKDKRYEGIRDISRMKPWHHKLFHNEITPPDEFKWQKERKFMKQRYARYGRASGVNPGVMWMTRKELKEKTLEDKQWSWRFYESVARLKATREEERQKREAKMKDFEVRCKKYPEMLEQFRERLRARQREADEVAAQKAEQIQEIQDYFGYAIDPSDPRFLAMLAKKEQEQKKAARQQRKQDQEAKLAKELDALTASAVKKEKKSDEGDSKKVQKSDEKS